MTIEEIQERMRHLEKKAIEWDKVKYPSVSTFTKLKKAREDLLEAIKQYGVQHDN